MEIIQGKTTVSEASHQLDLAPSEIEEWMERQGGMENALRAKPEDVREKCKRQLRAGRKTTATPCWSCAPEKKLQSLLGKAES